MWVLSSFVQGMDMESYDVYHKFFLQGGDNKSSKGKPFEAEIQSNVKAAAAASLEHKMTPDEITKEYRQIIWNWASKKTYSELKALKIEALRNKCYENGVCITVDKKHRQSTRKEILAYRLAHKLNEDHREHAHAEISELFTVNGLHDQIPLLSSWKDYKKSDDL